MRDRAHGRGEQTRTPVSADADEVGVKAIRRFANPARSIATFGRCHLGANVAVRSFCRNHLAQLIKDRFALFARLEYVKHEDDARRGGQPVSMWDRATTVLGKIGCHEDPSNLGQLALHATRGDTGYVRLCIAQDAPRNRCVAQPAHAAPWMRTDDDQVRLGRQPALFMNLSRLSGGCALSGTFDALWISSIGQRRPCQLGTEMP